MPRSHTGPALEPEFAEPSRPGALVIGEGLRCAFAACSGEPLPERLESLIGALGAACAPRRTGGKATR